VWILPWALSVDNITYGLVSGVPEHASVWFSAWFSAGEQTLSSAVQAGVGLLIAWGLVVLFPVLKRQVSLAFAFCGVAILAAAGAMLAFPSPSSTDERTFPGPPLSHSCLNYWPLRCLCALTPLPCHSRCWEKCA
jgi:hypothetical protein